MMNEVGAGAVIQETSRHAWQLEPFPSEMVLVQRSVASAPAPVPTALNWLHMYIHVRTCAAKEHSVAVRPVLSPLKD